MGEMQQARADLADLLSGKLAEIGRVLCMGDNDVALREFRDAVYHLLDTVDAIPEKEVIKNRYRCETCSLRHWETGRCKTLRTYVDENYSCPGWCLIMDDSPEHQFDFFERYW